MKEFGVNEEYCTWPHGIGGVVDDKGTLSPPYLDALVVAFVGVPDVSKWVRPLVFIPTADNNTHRNALIDCWLDYRRFRRS